MPVKNKNRQSNSGYEGVITGLNDEEKKVLEDAGIGGDIWLDITPYVNEDMTAISQEGYDLVWNAFYIASENPVNKYIGILFPDVNKAIFSGFVMHGDIFKIKFSVSADTDDEGRVQYDIFISSDKSISISTSAANGIWYKLDSLSFLNNVTQTQYDEIKTLATNGQLAGITDNNLYCPLYLIIGGAMGFQIPWTENGYISNNFFTIKEDLSVSLTDITPLVCPKTNPTSQVIPSINTANEQQNLTIGDGLVIENGALKTTGSGSGIATANVNPETFQLDTSSLTNKDQYVIASMDDGGGNIQYIPLQTYFTNAGYFNKEVKMQNYSRGFSLSLTDISFTSANNYTVNAKNTNVDFTSSLDSSKTWNKKGELKYITIEEQNILTGEKTYDYLEISGGDYSTEISALNSRVDSLANEVSQYSGSISSLDSRVSSLETASTSYAQAADVDMLNSRVSDIENTIGDINSILDNINGEVI